MFRNSLKMLLGGGKSNRKNRNSGGSSTDSDCTFEGDYTVPALPVTEGMQHIRIMEGVSRSLPSSPLLTHQAISMRLQPMKRLTAPLRKAEFVEDPRIPDSELGSPTHTSSPARTPNLDPGYYPDRDEEEAPANPVPGLVTGSLVAGRVPDSVRIIRHKPAAQRLRF